MLFNCGIGEDSWESLGLQGDPTSPSLRRSVLGVHWKDWCWSWNSSSLATSWEDLTHWKRLLCWEGLGAGGEGDNRGWDGWMASPTGWTWVWVNVGSWWWTGRHGVLHFMGSQRIRRHWVTELNWTEYSVMFMYHNLYIHLSVNGQVGYFHVLTIVNSAEMGKRTHVSFSNLVSSDYMPRSGITGSYGDFIHIF